MARHKKSGKMAYKKGGKMSYQHDEGAADRIDSSDADEDVPEDRKKQKMAVGAEKSDGGVTEDELTKAMDMLDNVAQSTEDERESLLQKALDGEIDEGENARLIELMGGGGDEEEPSLAKSVTSGLRPDADDRLQKSLDVSEYLDAQHEALTGALAELADNIEKSDTRQHNFNVVLAKGVRVIGGLVKSLDDRLANVEEQPVAQPRALRSAKQLPHLAKSFAGKGGGDKLSKGDVLNTLEAMHMEAIEKGKGGMALCGEDLNKSLAKYESTTTISRPLYEELMQYRANQAA